MAETELITVMAHPRLQPGRVALWERDDDHPAGEVFIAAPAAGAEARTFKVARTAGVNRAIDRKALVEAGSRAARGAQAEPASTTTDKKEEPAR